MLSDGVRLATERLILREAVDDDAPALLAYHLRNQERFAPWEPKAGTEVAQHRQWIAWRRKETDAGNALTLLAFDRAAPEALVGIVSLDGFTRTPRRTAMLSYTVDGAYEGKGYAREACEAMIAYAFDVLDIEELNATYDVANARSGGLLARLGFTVIASTPVIPGMERLMRAQSLAVRARAS
ncbi:MAG: [ribosomal protein S5]-alanine N-acetyltransferase [Candidatus Eremiobacteraeota bacterium]|nr:[ribosomal protein S5]-alanine N-acetyltransferase [Candidatus Eremiobacteraeota bacterium]